MSAGQVGAIILAAGNSSRLGQPKQLLQFQGCTLLRRAATLSLAVPFSPVVVILGADADRVEKEVCGLPIQAARNPRWQEGMASSIQAGLSALPGGVEAVAILLCDQPKIEIGFFRKLLAAYAAGRSLAAAEYDGSVGVPAIFTRRYFSELSNLHGKEGAKRILLRHLAEVERIPCPEAAVDIDSPGDLAILLGSSNLVC